MRTTAEHRLPRLAAAALTALALAAAPPPPAAAQTDEKANQIAERVLQTLGGKAAWDDAHFLRFRFAGFRNHHWDKWTGRHRVEFINQKGEHWVILENVNRREGRAWKNGTELAGEEAKAAVERGYATWINDTYWLLMPYKLRDPGVNLRYDGEEVIDGVTYDKLHLTFGNVGLTPGDQYWAYVNRESGLMDRWAYILQDFPEDRAAVAWKWSNWQRFGGILLASDRVSVDEGRELPLDNLAVESAVADAIFTDPTPIPEPPKGAGP